MKKNKNRWLNLSPKRKLKSSYKYKRKSSKMNSLKMVFHTRNPSNVTMNNNFFLTGTVIRPAPNKLPKREITKPSNKKSLIECFSVS